MDAGVKHLNVHIYLVILVTTSVRFVGVLGGFNPPLVEDDPHTGDWKFVSGGSASTPPPSPDPAWMKAGHHSAMDKRTGKQQKPVFLQTRQKLFLQL